MPLSKCSDATAPGGRRAAGLAAATLLLLSQFSVQPARAQLLNQLPGNLGQGQSGGGMLGGLGGGVPSVNQASPGNIAGVLQYCIKNNYLSGGAAQSVGSALAGKVGGASSGGFKSGSGGLLQTGNGGTFGLGSGGGGGGLKEQVTHKVCGLVLQHAKSLL